MPGVAVKVLHVNAGGHTQGHGRRVHCVVLAHADAFGILQAQLIVRLAQDGELLLGREGHVTRLVVIQVRLQQAVLLIAWHRRKLGVVVQERLIAAQRHYRGGRRRGHRRRTTDVVDQANDLQRVQRQACDKCAQVTPLSLGVLQRRIRAGKRRRIVWKQRACRLHLLSPAIKVVVVGLIGVCSRHRIAHRTFRRGALAQLHSVRHRGNWFAKKKSAIFCQRSIRPSHTNCTTTCARHGGRCRLRRGSAAHRCH